MSRVGRVLLNLSEIRRVPVDPSEVYFLEAVGGVPWSACDPNAVCGILAVSALSSSSSRPSPHHETKSGPVPEPSLVTARSRRRPGSDLLYDSGLPMRNRCVRLLR